MSTTDRYDDLLDGLDLFEAYLSGDPGAVEAFLASGSPEDRLESVLTVAQIVTHTLESTSGHGTGEVVEAVRRQLVHERGKTG